MGTLCLTYPFTLVLTGILWCGILYVGGSGSDVLTYRQISGIACGLEYLHSWGVIHSDLKSVRPVVLALFVLAINPSTQANVLISNDGRSMISNFRDSRLDTEKY